MRICPDFGNLHAGIMVPLTGRYRPVTEGSMATGGTMKKRTPLEEAIATRTDKRARYEAKMRAEGFKKTVLWLPVDCEGDIRQLVKLLGATNGELRRRLAVLVGGGR